MHVTQALRRAPSSIRRLRLTTKQASNAGGYYKGTGSGAMGRHTKHGGYVLQWDKVRTYVVPGDFDKCKLSPFVTKRITRQDLAQSNELGGKRMMGHHFLEQWKRENGAD